jgi:hypothetical protein
LKTFTLKVKMRFEIVQGDEQLSSHSGLSLIGAILDNIRERLDKVMLPGHPFPEISHGEVATAMIGLICPGKPDFRSIEPFRGDHFFAQSLGLDLCHPPQLSGSEQCQGWLHVGEEGYLANLKLRPGSDHSQKGDGGISSPNTAICPPDERCDLSGAYGLRQ